MAKLDAAVREEEWILKQVQDDVACNYAARAASTSFASAVLSSGGARRKPW
jgi:hypothetical protein